MTRFLVKLAQAINRIGVRRHVPQRPRDAGPSLEVLEDRRTPTFIVPIPIRWSPASVPNLSGIKLDFSQPGILNQDGTNRFLQINAVTDKGRGVGTFTGNFEDLDHNVFTGVSGSIFLKKGVKPSYGWYDFALAFSGKADKANGVTDDVIGSGDFDCFAISRSPGSYRSDQNPWLYSGSDTDSFVWQFNVGGKPGQVSHSWYNPDVIFHKTVR
jgi:hypothetical protein